MNVHLCDVFQPCRDGVLEFWALGPCARSDMPLCRLKGGMRPLIGEHISAGTVETYTLNP